MNQCKLATIESRKPYSASIWTPSILCLLSLFVPRTPPLRSYKLLVGRRGAGFISRSIFFFLFLLLVFGGLRCALHKLVHILLRLGVCFLCRHRSHTLWHLFVVTARWKAILGRRDSLAKIVILEVDALSQIKHARHSRQLQVPCASQHPKNQEFERN